MLIIYNLSIRLYKLFIYTASSFNPKAKLWIEGRKDLLAKIKDQIPTDYSCVWFHFPSLGEFEQGRNVLEEFKKKHSEYKIIVTFFSPSGYELRKDYAHADHVFYLPLDTESNAKTFLDIIRPKMVFFTKYDYWYHFFKNIRARNIPLYMISAIFRKDQLFFKSYGAFYRKILSYVSHFFIQNKESGNLLRSIGINNYTVCGDTRFDRVHYNSLSPKPLPLIQKFASNKRILVAGSTWEADERRVLVRINRKDSELKWILVPHEIEEEHLAHLQQSINTKSIRYSQYHDRDDNDYQVLIIDSIGLLMHIYPYAYICFIGGGFGKGIHNTLEAAVFGKPVLFGPNYQKFKEAKDLISVGAAFSITDAASFESTVDMLLQSEALHHKAAQAASNYVRENTGATGKIMGYLDGLK